MWFEFWLFIASIFLAVFFCTETYNNYGEIFHNWVRDELLDRDLLLLAQIIIPIILLFGLVTRFGSVLYLFGILVLVILQPIWFNLQEAFMLN